MEVPFNSPDPLGAITVLRQSLPDDAVVGAGTVLDKDQVRAAHHAGAQIIVSPNVDAEVIAETLRLGMNSYPGVATATEAFCAVHAGAHAVKLFPADQVGISVMKAWMAVIPPQIEFLPVGGVDTENITEWVQAGATGFGIGSSLYRPDRDLHEIAARAVALVTAWKSANNNLRSLT